MCKFRIELKVFVIGDSMVTFLPLDKSSSKNDVVNIMKHPGSTTDNIFDYAKRVAWKKRMI